jgi:hypothetical protein
MQVRFGFLIVPCFLMSCVGRGVGPDLVVGGGQIVMGHQADAVPTAGGVCAFDTRTMTFRGPADGQVRCLLAPVFPLARLGSSLSELPPTLDALVGRPVAIEPGAAAAYFAAEGLMADSLGTPLSRTSGGLDALYFVIHDTSSPNFLTDPFPADIAGDRSINNLSRYHSDQAAAHVFVNRRGEVYVGHDFATPWRATRLESRFAGNAARGRFIHIELIQPRRSDPDLGQGNDALAPAPGFSEAQYRRLAQLYVVASVRSGTWLLPGFHAVLDSGIPGGHDDPQNFDLEAFDAALGRVIGELGG